MTTRIAIALSVLLVAAGTAASLALATGSKGGSTSYSVGTLDAPSKYCKGYQGYLGTFQIGSLTLKVYCVAGAPSYTPGK